jgi:hypothetical protein
MDAPPKTLRDRLKSQVGEFPVVPASGDPVVSGPGGRLARRQESLPVLEAFQEFLDFERRKTRRRFYALMGLFAVVIVAIVFTGALFGSLAVGRVKARLAEFRDQMEHERLAAQSTLGEVREGNLTVLDGVQTAISSNTAAVRSELASLRELVTLLDVRNATLQTEVERLNLVGPLAEPSRQPDADVQAGSLPDSAGREMDLAIPLTNGESLSWRILLPH